jgi:hypothetical protein
MYSKHKREAAQEEEEEDDELKVEKGDHPYVSFPSASSTPINAFPGPTAELFTLEDVFNLETDGKTSPALHSGAPYNDCELPHAQHRADEGPVEQA